MLGLPAFAGSPARLSNAIRRPSGDHLGLPVTYAPPSNNKRGLAPSLSLAQMPKLPFRPERKAMRVPSGE
jgi:hypothetical protein